MVEFGQGKREQDEHVEAAFFAIAEAICLYRLQALAQGKKKKGK